MIISFITPNNAFVPVEFMKSILALPPRFNYYSAQGPSLPDNRNRCYEHAKKMNEDLLFIDSDIVFTPEDVSKVEEHLKTLDVISGIYLLGYPPAEGIPAIFGLKKEKDYEYIKPGKELFQIGACGGGFLGVSKRVYPVLCDNPFDNYWEGAIVHGEDISFCHRINEAGLKVWCDATICVGHIRQTTRWYGK